MIGRPLAAGRSADFSFASSDFRASGAFFCFVTLAARRPESRTAPPHTDILEEFPYLGAPHQKKN
jgi:hypothetical protein